MKVRDSDMPKQRYWENFFNVPLVLDQMKITRDINSLVEFGCGYGTFTLPIANKISGLVTSLEIDDRMLKIVNKRLNSQHQRDNVCLIKRDFIVEGTGLNDESVDYVVLFNIMHHIEPFVILKEAYRIMKKGGKAGIVHWYRDPLTPWGPNIQLCPKPEEMCRWVLATGFEIAGNKIVNLPPYHYGVLVYRG